MYSEQLNIEKRRKEAVNAQRLAIQKQEGEMYAEELKIQNAKKEADNAQRILTAEMANDLQKKRIELENESDKHALALKIEYEKETQKLK